MKISKTETEKQATKATSAVPITDEYPSNVKAVYENIEARIAAETIGIEFLKELQPIVESRRKLKEAEEDMVTLLQGIREMFDAWGKKFDALNDMKKENLLRERKLMDKINAEIGK